MVTLSTVMEKMRQKGYDKEFELDSNKFWLDEQSYLPEDLTIIRTFRFEGESDPADSSILYLIEANDGAVGYTMDAYGAYSTHEDGAKFDEFIKKIKVKDREDDQILK